tara:strand:+ start:436 stop:711 length:276 start_codon:yes stop_codon:yes gene_type:complete
MAVGDSIISRGSTFVPAAGVEIMVLWVFTDNAAIYIGLQNAAGDIIKNVQPNPNVGGGGEFAPIIKMSLTNTWFFYSNITTDQGFTGIQIK